MSLLDRLAGMLGRSAQPAPVQAEGDHAPVPLPQIVRGSALFDDLTASSAGLPTPTEHTAWTVSAIAACVNLIAGAISSLPLHVYRRSRGGDRERLFDDPLWWVLNEEMTPRWSAATGWEYLVTSRLLLGDAFAEIRRGPGGAVTGIEPLHPNRVTVAPWPDGSRLAYAIAPDPTIPAGYRAQQAARVIDQDDMLHISGTGFDGCRTPSPLRHMLRMSGSVALATQEFSARFFSNGARPDYALRTEQGLTPDQIEALRAQVDERHGGTARAHRPMLLHSGLDVKALQLPLEDLALIATRQFQIEEIARAYGVPPFMIGHNEKTTSWGSGVEAMGTAFVRYTLGGHLKKIHNEFNRKLFRTATRVVEFDTFELERADLKSLMEAFRTAIGRAGEPGFLSVNEVRSFLNFGPVDGGQELNKGVSPGGSNAPQPAQPAGQ